MSNRGKRGYKFVPLLKIMVVFDMIKYYRYTTVSNDDYVYSCDMLRLSLVIDKRYLKDIEKFISDTSRFDFEVYPLNTIPFKYRHMIKISVGESSAIFGVGFNGCTRDDMLRCFLEFNPNKCMPAFYQDFNFILLCCSSVKISRMDLAIDIPISREYLHLSRFNGKGCRSTYTSILKTYEDKTEYLGTHQHFGFVKLYNKQKESNLDCVMSRLEITTECDIEKFSTHIPVVVVDRLIEDCLYEDISLHSSELQPLQQALVSALNLLEFEERQSIFNRLDKRQKQKLRPYIKDSDLTIQLDLKAVNEVFERVKEMCYISH